MADLSKTLDFFSWLKFMFPEIHLLPWQESFIEMYFHNKSKEVWNRQLLSMPRLGGKTFVKNLIKEFEDR